MLVDFKIKDQLLKILIIFVIANTFQIAKASQTLDRIVAVVGDEIITNQELQQKFNIVASSLKNQNVALPSTKLLTQQVLEKMIIECIQLQMAKNFAIDVDSNSLNHAITDLAKDQNLTVAQYKSKIEQEGLSFKEFREQLKKEITISRLHQREIFNEIRVSTAEIDSYINSPVGQDHSGTEYRLAHILISSLENPTQESVKNLDQKVATIMSEIKRGKDFKQLATSYSSGMQALDGGDLGWRKLSEIPSIFVNYVVNMKVNEVVGSIKSSSGLHIIKLQDKRSRNQAIYELKARQIFLTLKNKDEKQVVAELINLRKKITEDGQDFAKLAANKSEESSTAVKGGDLGWFKKEAVLSDFWEQVNKLKLGEISTPFKTELGWHLVRLEDRRNISKSKDNIRERALEALREQKFNEALESWLKKIRSEAKVQIFL